MSDSVLSFLNEPDDSAAVSESQKQTEIRVKLYETLNSVLPEQLPAGPQDSTGSQNPNSNSLPPENSLWFEKPHTEDSDPVRDPDSKVVVIDVSKPIQLSQNCLIVVDGQKCILQHDSGQILAYPVKEPEKTKRRRGRPRKTERQESVEPENTVTCKPLHSDSENSLENDITSEKGLLEIMNDDGALVRRTTRKRKKAKSLRDYETGNLRQELGSDMEDMDHDNDDVSIKKKGKHKIAGRPRKYPFQPNSTYEALKNGKQQRGRPIPYVLDTQPTQAFLIETADGQNLMMQIPLSTIPPGMSMQDVATDIANKLNLGISQNENTLMISSSSESEVTNEAIENCESNQNVLKLHQSQMDHVKIQRHLSTENNLDPFDENNMSNQKKDKLEDIHPAIQDHIIGSSTILSFAHISQMETIQTCATDEFIDSTSKEIQPIIRELSSGSDMDEMQKSALNQMEIIDKLQSGVICEKIAQELNESDAQFMNSGIKSIVYDQNINITVMKTSSTKNKSNALLSILNHNTNDTFMKNDKSVLIKNEENISQASDMYVTSSKTDMVKKNFEGNDYIQNITVSTSSESKYSQDNSDILLLHNESENITGNILSSLSVLKSVIKRKTINDVIQNVHSVIPFQEEKFEDNVKSTVVEAELECRIKDKPNFKNMFSDNQIENVGSETSAVIDDILRTIIVTDKRGSSDSSYGNICIEQNIEYNRTPLGKVHSKELGEDIQTVTSSGLVPGTKSLKSKEDETVQLQSSLKKKRGRPRKHSVMAKASSPRKLFLALLEGDVTAQQRTSSILGVNTKQDLETNCTFSMVSKSSGTVISVNEKVLPLLLPKTDVSASCYKMKKFQCPKCNFHAAYNYEYQQHLMIHADETKQCKCCQYRSFSEEDLIGHYKDVHPRCICMVCNYMAEHSYVIKRHMYRHVDNGCTCEICGKTYKDHYILKMHIKMVHMPAEVLFECQLCSKEFNRKAHLKRHLRTHDPDKPFKCFRCDYRGCEKSDITKHMLIHQDPKHQCEICGKSFRHIKNKDLHVKRHKGQRDYKCGVCDFYGYTFTDIRKHIERRHKDPKFIVCEKCGQACNSEEQLKEHQNSSHCETFLLEQELNKSEGSFLHLPNKDDATHAEVDTIPVDVTSDGICNPHNGD